MPCSHWNSHKQFFIHLEMKKEQCQTCIFCRVTNKFRWIFTSYCAIFRCLPKYLNDTLSDTLYMHSMNILIKINPSRFSNEIISLLHNKDSSEHRLLRIVRRNKVTIMFCYTLRGWIVFINIFLDKQRWKYLSPIP